jgi:hypothetical protein
MNQTRTTILQRIKSTCPASVRYSHFMAMALIDARLRMLWQVCVT